MIRKTFFRYLCVCLFSMMMLSAMVRADVVKVRDRRPMIGVKIIELNNGRLYYRLHTARVTSQPIERIKYLQVLGWTEFNEGERKQRNSQLHQAINAYRKAIKELSSSPGWQKLNHSEDNRHLDRRLLAKCRMVGVLDREGQFDAAVKEYLDIVVLMPACLKSLRPTNMPAADSEFLEPAREMVIRAIEQHKKDKIGVALAKWLREWPDGDHEGSSSSSTGSVPASQPSEKNEHPTLNINKPNPPTKSKSGQEKAKKVAGDIDILVQEKRYEEALRRIAVRMDKGGRTSDALPVLFYWKGRALAGKSQQSSKAGADEVNVRRSGLAFMRVVIHYPAHALAPECLYRAGLLYRQADQDRKAERLWSELIRRYPEADPWANKAGQGLAEIKAASNGDS